MTIKASKQLIYHAKGGNMLLLVGLSIGLMALALCIALGFFLLLSQQKLGQTQSDSIAIELAKSLNEGNRIGQMNEIVEYARELVYVSRQNLNDANTLNMPDATALADLLLDESTESAKTVEKERLNQIDIAINACRNRLTEIADARTESGTYLLPWFIENQLYLRKARFMTTDDSSNVSSPQVLKELNKFDLEKHYVDKISNLYFGNINAKLPAPDTQLNFYLSALPAQVENTSSPARLANDSDLNTTAFIFDSEDPAYFTKPQQLPEAVQVLGNMFVITNDYHPQKKPVKTEHIDNQQNRLNISANSMAIAPGAINDTP